MQMISANYSANANQETTSRYRRSNTRLALQTRINEIQT